MFKKVGFIHAIRRPLAKARSWFEKDKKIVFGLFLFFAFISVYTISKTADSDRVIYKSNYQADFNHGRILNNPKSSFLKGKELLLAKATKQLLAKQTDFMNRIEFLEKKFSEERTPKKNEISKTTNLGVRQKENNQIKYHPQNDQIKQRDVSSKNSGEHLPFLIKKGRRPYQKKLGPSVISFPVEQNRIEQGVVLPTGSYVKAKLMTGINAPEGKTYPVLLALDYSYIGPNKHRVDLSGCFMIAKTSPSLATERINFQANRLSCVSKSGKFFEKTISGFVADDSDNSFAIKAEVHSKQGRVARMAFMKSIVDGIGEIITRKSKSIGGKNPDPTGVTIQNGVQGAASKVSDWYLKQATSLLPTLSVGSGHDVWVIMQESITLPNDFFRKDERRQKDAKVFSYFSRATN